MLRIITVNQQTEQTLVLSFRLRHFEFEKISLYVNCMLYNWFYLSIFYMYLDQKDLLYTLLDQSLFITHIYINIQTRVVNIIYILYHTNITTTIIYVLHVLYMFKWTVHIVIRK